MSVQIRPFGRRISCVFEAFLRLCREEKPPNLGKIWRFSVTVPRNSRLNFSRDIFRGRFVRICRLNPTFPNKHEPRLFLVFGETGQKLVKAFVLVD